MKILLRSVFTASASDNADLLFRNALKLMDSGLVFDVPEERAIWQQIQDFIQHHRHVPDRASLLSHFNTVKEPEICDLLESVAAFPAIVRGDFIQRLETKADEKRTRHMRDILAFAGDIISTGKTIKEGRKEIKLRGAIDAVRYISENSHDIVAPTLGTRLSGEVTKDGESFKQEYERVEADPLAGIGQFCGLQQMDDALRGAKRAELWIHAAFTGGLKSILLLNWAYTQAIFYGHSSLLFSLEMPYQQCRRMLFSMHSFHDKFSAVRTKLKLQKDINSPVGVPYERIRDGELTVNEKKFLFDYVEPDFAGKPTPRDLKPYKDGDGNPLSPPGGYGEIHIEVADPDKDDFTMPDLRSKAEVLYSRSPFQTIFVDHIGLMAPRSKGLNSTTEKLNEVLRDCKKLAMSFNRGQGIAVVGAFQISRKGYESALKTGSYLLSHLSYANEAERSADNVTSTFVSEEMQKVNRVKFQCLKSRDNAPFPAFMSRVEYSCRRLLTDFGVEMVGGKKTTAISDDDLGRLLDDDDTDDNDS